MPDDPRPVARFPWGRTAGPVGLDKPSIRKFPDAGPEADVSRLEREWQERVIEARAAGRREGEAAGRSRAEAEIEPVLQRLSRSIQELADLKPRLRREAEADMVKLAVAIARRIVRRELSIDPEALHGLVLAALEKLQAQEICRVRVHHSQTERVASILRSRSHGNPIEVAPDASCDPGAVIFETERGNLDASVECQLGEIERGLADLLRRHG
jgi:flagellar assembly protein FliH